MREYIQTVEDSMRNLWLNELAACAIETVEMSSYFDSEFLQQLKESTAELKEREAREALEAEPLARVINRALNLSAALLLAESGHGPTSHEVFADDRRQWREHMLSKRRDMTVRWTKI